MTMMQGLVPMVARSDLPPDSSTGACFDPLLVFTFPLDPPTVANQRKPDPDDGFDNVHSQDAA